MTEPRAHKLTSVRGLVGGMAMLAIEALIVVGLIAVALLISIVVLSIL